MSCWRKRLSCVAHDQTKANPGLWPGFVSVADWRKLASGLLSGGRRIDGPLVGAEVAEQHLTGLQIFLGEATARRWASVDGSAGDDAGADHGPGAHSRNTGNRCDIRHADAAAA